MDKTQTQELKKGDLIVNLIEARINRNPEIGEIHHISEDGMQLYTKYWGQIYERPITAYRLATKKEIERNKIKKIFKK